MKRSQGKKGPARLKKFTGMTIQGVSSDLSKDIIPSNGDSHQHLAVLFQIHYSTWTLPSAKDASNPASVCTTYPQYQAPLIIHSYTTQLCNIIRIWYICCCSSKMRTVVGTNCETDYISYISAWEKLLKFKMLELTEKQEISWGISASRNLIAQLKNCGLWADAVWSQH